MLTTLSTIKAAAERDCYHKEMSVSELGDALEAARQKLTVDGLTGRGIGLLTVNLQRPMAVKIEITTTKNEDGTTTLSGSYKAM